MQVDSEHKHLPSRKGKELPQRDLQPTDLDEKLTALRRRTAGSTRPRDKSERMQPTQQSAISSHSRTERSPKATTAIASIAPRQSPSSPRKHASPHVIISRPIQDADPEDFSRRLRISSSPSPRPSQSINSHKTRKLFNPETDPIPMRRTADPESILESIGTPQGSRAPTATNHREDRSNAPRQLFDHRKDDPVRFSVMARPQVSAPGRPSPTPKSSGDYVSASSTSSYAASISSSAFTLSSTTDGSSASSALFDGRPNQEQAGNSVFGVQLKKLYREITNLETKVKQEDSMDDTDDLMSSRVVLKGKELENEDFEKEKWKKQISDHKILAENIHNLLEISLSPSVPASLRNIPTKYNIIVRLWTYAFHKLLESLRRAAFASPLALEHLQDFIYYAYTFYTGLLEEPALNPFKSGWLEALGDLAWYRMAVAAMVNGNSGGKGGLTIKAVSEATAAEFSDTKKVKDAEISPSGSVKSVSDAPAARIDDSPSPSIGVAAARLLEVEPEKERWRNIARDWYAAGIAEQPGTGKLHHHLGLLSREVEGEELRGVYHFVKSMTTLHPFPTSRESILPIWSHVAQARRSIPDAKASDLFVLLHGMLFTNIQLDDFQPTLARFIERLEIEGAEEREWIMMGIVNIASIMEYGRPGGVLRKVGCVGSKEVGGHGPQAASAIAMRVQAKKVAAGILESKTMLGGVDEERMDVDEEHHGHHLSHLNHHPSRSRDSIMKSPTLPDTEPQACAGDEDSNGDGIPDQPPAFKFALQLSFSMLSYVLRHPTRKSSQYARSTLNPYLTVILTFLATVLKHRPTLETLERSIPWADLAAFFAVVPRKIMINQGLMVSPNNNNPGNTRNVERWIMLTSGCPPPLPEDWCLRGMEWVGRKVFERGFWKSGEEKKAELEVLEMIEGKALTDGTIEDDDGDDSHAHKTSSSPLSGSGSELVRRWVRIIRCGVNIAGAVDGFNWVEGSREWNVEGKLLEKGTQWKEEDQAEREEEERRRMGKRWTEDPMDVDDDADVEDDSVSEESEDDENDSEEVKALKARRRYLKSLLQSAKRGNATVSSSPPHRRPRARVPKKAIDSRVPLLIIPGYTVLVVDTNILLSSLSMVSSLIESLRWTIIIPLPVIMELDGLSANTSQLGEAAQTAMAYVSSHIRSHALSLKVQTSKGNYLTSLNVRTEEVHFDRNHSIMEKNMDDLILKAAIWQDDYWVDRSAMLKAETAVATNAVKVVLLSLDRNLRLKARSRQLPAASEKDLAALLATAR